MTQWRREMTEQDKKELIEILGKYWYPHHGLPDEETGCVHLNIKLANMPTCLYQRLEGLIVRARDEAHAVPANVVRLDTWKKKRDE
jgi:hypothetical protein